MSRPETMQRRLRLARMTRRELELEEDDDSEPTRAALASHVAVSELAERDVERTQSPHECRAALEGSSSVTSLVVAKKDSVTTYSVRPSYVAPWELNAEACDDLDLPSDGPIDYEAVRSYLFADEPYGDDEQDAPYYAQPEPVRSTQMRPPPPAPSSRAREVEPPRPVRFMADEHTPIPSILPSDVQAARHHAMSMPVAHAYEAPHAYGYEARYGYEAAHPALPDSSVDMQWGVSSPSRPRPSLPELAPPSPFQFTLTSVAVVLAGLVLLAVIVLAVAFVRSETPDARPITFTQMAPMPQADPGVTAATTVAPPVIAPFDPAPVVGTTDPKTMPLAPRAVTAPVPKIESAPAASTSARSKPVKRGSKSVEEILQELGEEQVRR